MSIYLFSLGEKVCELCLPSFEDFFAFRAGMRQSNCALIQPFDRILHWLGFACQVIDGT